ncbi:unnamed protein product [Polarella glacialis]|uniref:Uncharacterized protein n=1 Tax=Polarella glacialis TaxID=89957 RepID=A0A813GCV6_POLGL|nr:unnamed protein product [Polarella glacialis]CAE8635622.1 unnamed protein product [Polarella glacialis]
MSKKSANKFSPASSSSAPAPQTAPAPAPQGAAAAPQAAPAVLVGTPPVQLEPWQAWDSEWGMARCTLCNKVIDTYHLKTEPHIKRLEAWQQARDREEAGNPAPPLPHIAMVPWTEGDPLSCLYRMCLLCTGGKKEKRGTWVNDDSSHSGTHENPSGSKDHQKNLRNCLPTDPWYVENVTMARMRYHPELASQQVSGGSSSSSLTALPSPSAASSFHGFA